MKGVQNEWESERQNNMNGKVNEVSGKASEEEEMNEKFDRGLI